MYTYRGYTHILYVSKPQNLNSKPCFSAVIRNAKMQSFDIVRVCAHIHIINKNDLCIFDDMYTGWQRPIGCLIFICHFPQKSPVVSGSFAENNLQLKASYGSLPLCAHSMSSIHFDVLSL